MFLGVAESVAGSLLCYGVGIVQCLFNILYTSIGDKKLVCNTNKLPRKRIRDRPCPSRLCAPVTGQIMGSWLV